MGDELKPNLEPIEESDLGLKEKFLGGKVPEKTDAGRTAESAPEVKAEMKEGVAEKDDSYAKILSQVQSAQPIAHDDVPADAKNVSLEQDEESKIQNLINLAGTKGVRHAVNVARHLEDNYALDEFHDRMLSEELRKALVQKGMIKDI